MTDGEIERAIESYIDLGRSEVQAELDPHAIRRDIEQRIAELTADEDDEE